MKNKVYKKEILRTLRTYNTTKICKLMKKCVGYVPKKTPYISEVDDDMQVPEVLDTFEVYRWASQYATSDKMKHKLYDVLSKSNNKRSYGDEYAYLPHGWYKPLPRLRAHRFFEAQKREGLSNYSKIAVIDDDYLMSCSPVYLLSDYNKHYILRLEGNERFCDILVRKYNRDMFVK